MRKRRVVNLNRGTRIHAGIEAGELLLFIFVGYFTFVALAPAIASTIIRVLLAGAAIWFTYLALAYVKDRYGPGYIGDFLRWVATPDEYHPIEDPEPYRILKPEGGAPQHDSSLVKEDPFPAEENRG